MNRRVELKRSSEAARLDLQERIRKERAKWKIRSVRTAVLKRNAEKQREKALKEENMSHYLQQKAASERPFDIRTPVQQTVPMSALAATVSTLNRWVILLLSTFCCRNLLPAYSFTHTFTRMCLIHDVQQTAPMWTLHNTAASTLNWWMYILIL